jgi:DNA-binding XRE family transcriptional regulator
MNKKEIASKLVELRGSRTQQEVADAIGVSVSAIGMYETGERVPKDDIKIRLANFYVVKITDIFFSEQCHT